MTNFQPPLPSAHFLNQPPGSRNGQAKVSTNNAPVPQPTSQQANMTVQATPQMQQQQLYAHYQMQAAAAQRLNAQAAANGRSTPQGPPMSRSPMNPGQGAAPRNSPSRALASRSPMLPSTQAVPPMTHPQQHLGFPVTQNPYNTAHMRMVHPNGSPHPQTLSAHLVSPGAQPSPSPGQPGQQPASSQDQAHPPQSVVAQYPTHMFSYTQVGMNYPMQTRGVPPAFAWTMGMGRGQPQAMQTAALPQQMPKAVPGALPGR